ncbi:MAG: response regulator, partial [Candidatus Accumulibacter phosphatis]
AERQAAEVAARREAERQAAEVAARREAERQAAEVAARREAERQAVEVAARREADRLAVEEALRQEEDERQAVEAAIERETQRQAEEAQRTRAATAAALAPKLKTEEQTVVMIADDSKVVRVKTSRLLTAHRYQVLMAEDGLDAARQIEISAPDVLVTDVDMPGMNGLQLSRQLRDNPRTAHLPIIMVTSDNEQLRADAAAAGVNVVLGKPYPEEQLISHIQQLLRSQAGA